jgi:hypothetical protein
MEDSDSLPQFALLQRLPEPATPKEHKTQWEIHKLLDRTVEQQVESSLS